MLFKNNTFSPPRVPPVETTYLTTQYDNTKIRITPSKYSRKKATLLTKNFSVGQFLEVMRLFAFSEALRLFLPPRVPPIETTYLTTYYSNAKEKLCCLLKTFA